MKSAEVVKIALLFLPRYPIKNIDMQNKEIIEMSRSEVTKNKESILYLVSFLYRRVKAQKE